MCKTSVLLPGCVRLLFVCEIVLRLPCSLAYFSVLRDFVRIYIAINDWIAIPVFPMTDQYSSVHGISHTFLW